MRERWNSPNFRKLTTLKCNGYGLADPNKMSDIGLKEIAKMKSLTRLQLKYHRATKDGVAELQRALPNCVLEIETPAK